MKRWVLIAIGGLLAGPAEAAPTSGLYLFQPVETPTSAVEMVIGEGVLQIGYLPEPALADRHWYGSLRLPISVVPEGKWWPGVRAMVGYHRQQAPIGLPFQAIEYGGALSKELPLNLKLYGLGTMARSLSAGDTLGALSRLEAGIGYQPTPGARLFAGYQLWQSPTALGTATSAFSSSRSLSGWIIGVDIQLSHLAGFSEDR